MRNAILKEMFCLITPSVIVISVALSGCDGEFAYDRRIDGPYFLNAPSALWQMSVTFKGQGDLRIGRIPETISAIGWNEHYITARQHPPNQPTRVFYYYLDRKRDNLYGSAKDSVVGPITEQAFLTRQKELYLPPVTMSVPLKD